MTLSRVTYNQQKTCLYLANATPARFNRQWLRLRRRDSEQECRPRSVRPENWRFLGRSDERRSDASFAWIAWLSHGVGEEAAILSDVWLESEVLWSVCLPGSADRGFHLTCCRTSGFRMGGTLDLTETTPTSTPHATTGQTVMSCPSISMSSSSS